MISEEIYKALFERKAFDGSLFCIDNVYLFPFESDFLSVSRSGFMTEYEVKVSKADFKADLIKERYVYPQRKSRLKHEMLTEGYEGLKHFYFIAPEGLIKLEELPEHCGLIEMVTRKNGDHPDYYEMVTVKKAPQLPVAAKINEEQKTAIIGKYQWRYSQIKRQLIDNKIEKHKESSKCQN